MASRGSFSKDVVGPMGGADLEFSRSHGILLKIQAKTNPFPLWIQDGKGSKGKYLSLNPPSSHTKVEPKGC